MNYTSIFGTQNRKTKLGLVLLGLFFVVWMEEGFLLLLLVGGDMYVGFFVYLFGFLFLFKTAPLLR